MNLRYILVFRLQLFNEDVSGFQGLEGGTTSKNVGGSVPILGPSVDGDMGLGDGQDTGDSLGAELVEGLPYHMSADILSGHEQGITDVFYVIQKLGVTFLKLEQHMLT